MRWPVQRPHTPSLATVSLMFAHIQNCTDHDLPLLFFCSKKRSLFLWMSAMLFHSLSESSAGPMPSARALGAGMKSTYRNHSPEHKRSKSNSSPWNCWMLGQSG